MKSMIRPRALALSVLFFVPLSAASAQTYSVVHSFANNSTDGGFSQSTLVQDKKGNIWGTTALGGANAAGVVFEIATDGTYSVVRSFGSDGADGINPVAGLMQDKKG